MGWQSASWHNASLRKFLETDWERSWGVKVWWYDMLPNNTQSRGQCKLALCAAFSTKTQTYGKAGLRIMFYSAPDINLICISLLYWAATSTWLRLIKHNVVRSQIKDGPSRQQPLSPWKLYQNDPRSLQAFIRSLNTWFWVLSARHILMTKFSKNEAIFRAV